MKRSTSRILTTHAGRLNGPDELTAMARQLSRGQSTDRAGYTEQVKQASLTRAVFTPIPRAAAAFPPVAMT